MTRYFIFLSFRGTLYNGWQVQPQGQTVQGVLAKALSTILKVRTEVTGAGRTDSGVHASFFCAHFDSSHDDLHTNGKLLYNLNGLLPPDIAISKIVKVKSDANARFDALSRTYQYTITREKDPFVVETALLLYWPLDVEKMNEASAVLLNHSDFTSFARLHGGNKTNICSVTHASWEEVEQRLIFSITADRFLRNMVRAVVGTLITVGRGKLSIAEFESILNGRNRGLASQSAPAHGLSLTGIDYPGELFI